MFVFNKENEERIFFDEDKLPYHLTQYVEELCHDSLSADLESAQEGK